MGVTLLDEKTTGGKWPDRPGKVLISGTTWDEIGKFAGLSDRELQVSRLIFEGGTRAEVAAELDLSPRTIRHYMEILHSKLRVANRVELVLRLVQIRDHLAESDGG